MHAVVILARTLTCDTFHLWAHEAIVDACMHHFDLHRERLINFTNDEDSFGLYIYYVRSI